MKSFMSIKLLAFCVCSVLMLSFVFYGAYAIFVASPPSGGCSMGICF